MTIRIVKGNIMEQPVDYIVNAANPHLAHGGGIARAIEKAADPLAFSTSDVGPNDEILAWRRDHKNAPLVPTGLAHLTSAGMLPYKGVIHAVGPVWGGGVVYESELLRSAYSSSYAVLLSTVEDPVDDLPSIAFPSISTGIFGFPVEDAALIALTEAHKWKGVNTTFALFDDYTYDAFQDALDRLVTT